MRLFSGIGEVLCDVSFSSEYCNSRYPPTWEEPIDIPEGETLVGLAAAQEGDSRFLTRIGFICAK